MFPSEEQVTSSGLLLETYASHGTDKSGYYKSLHFTNKMIHQYNGLNPSGAFNATPRT